MSESQVVKEAEKADENCKDDSESFDKKSLEEKKEDLSKMKAGKSI